MIHLPAKRNFAIQPPALYVLRGVNRWLAEGALPAAAMGYVAFTALAESSGFAAELGRGI